MSDRTLLILGALGLAGFWLWSTKPVAPVATTVPPPPVNPYASAMGLYQPPTTYMPRDPGDTNNWQSALITGLSSLGTTAMTTFGGSGNTGSGYQGSSTPDGWVDPWA
jgi:hypothetical protein